MKFRRKQMIVKGRFQSGYIGWFLLTTIVIATLALVIMYWGVWRSSINEFSTQRITEDMGLAKRIQEYEAMRQQVGSPDAAHRRAMELFAWNQQETVKEILQSARNRMIPATVIVIAICFVASLMLSHRIAGPIWKMEKNLRALNSGNLDVSFRIRKRDEFHSLAAELEEHTGRLKELLNRLEILGRELADVPGTEKARKKKKKAISSFKK